MIAIISDKSKLFGEMLLKAKPLWQAKLKHGFCTICPSPLSPIVTVLDVSSAVGANLALLLKQNPLINELRIYNENRDTWSMADDLNNIDTSTNVIPFSCKCLRQAITGAHLVVSTGGCQHKIGQSAKDLFEKNLDNVRNVAIFLSEFNPNAVYCIAKPPIEALVPLVSEEYKKADCYDPRKIIGVTTPASMIANKLISHHLAKDPASILCPIIGGYSPLTTIPIVSQTKPKLDLNAVKYKELQQEVANAEENLLKLGTMFCFSRSVAIARFINLVLKALKGEQTTVECAFVAQIGHIRDFLPYMTSIVKLGKSGVSSTHMPKMNDIETETLKAAAPFILENIQLGHSFLHEGNCVDTKYFQKKRRCDAILKEKMKEISTRGGQ